MGEKVGGGGGGGGGGQGVWNFLKDMGVLEVIFY